MAVEAGPARRPKCKHRGRETFQIGYLLGNTSYVVWCSDCGSIRLPGERTWRYAVASYAMGIGAAVATPASRKPTKPPPFPVGPAQKERLSEGRKR